MGSFALLEISQLELNVLGIFSKLFGIVLVDAELDEDFIGWACVLCAGVEPVKESIEVAG